MPHPRRHHGVAPGHGQPRQGVGQRPASLRRLGEDCLALLAAGGLRKPLADGLLGFGGGWPRRLAQGGEEGIKSGCRAFRGRQPVPSDQQLRRRFAQRLALVGQKLQRQAGVQFRVIHPPAPELPVLIMLDQAVVGIARKGQRTEPQSVDGRQPQEPKIGLGRLQVRQIEIDEVVA